MEDVKTFVLALNTDKDDDGRTVFERIIAEVDNNYVMFKKEDGEVFFSKDEDDGIEKDYYVMNSENLDEMSMFDFNLSEMQDFYKCLCERNYKNELRA